MVTCDLHCCTQARKARRYDVSKSVLDKGARRFWCTQFGAEHHEVSTGRLIETLLFESKATSDFTDRDRTVVYEVLRKVGAPPLLLP